MVPGECGVLTWEAGVSSPAAKSDLASVEELAIAVLRCAQGLFPKARDRVPACTSLGVERPSGVVLHDAWILALHGAFREAYRNHADVTVHGKPLATNRHDGGARRGEFRRGEYGFDLAVVQTALVEAPYHRTRTGRIRVPIVVRHLWQVESEMSNSARVVSEDIGKLVGGDAANKLLVARIPGQREGGERWRGFLGSAARHASGQMFVALMPSYGGTAGSREWTEGVPKIELFRRNALGALCHVVTLAACPKERCP